MDPKTMYLPYIYAAYLVLITMLTFARDTISGGAYVISNQDPRWTQKPTYIPIFPHHIRSWLLCTTANRGVKTLLPVQREHLDNEKKMACRAVSRLNEADFHKPGIYRSGRVWAHAWDVFPRMPSRVGRGRRAAAVFVVCFGWGGFFFCVFFFDFFFFERHGLLQVWGRLASFTSLLVMRLFFAFRAKSLFISGCVQGAII